MLERLVGVSHKGEGFTQKATPKKENIAAGVAEEYTFGDEQIRYGREISQY
jgi:hypothetical protein